MYDLAVLFGKTHENAKFYLLCAQNWFRMYQGGNMWSAWDCYLTASRDILGLRLPEHEKYSAWEECAKLGGFRIMHDEFCIVSDRPEILLVDDQNRPHCATGPSHRWRDGWSLYHVHGVRVDGWIIENPELITVEKIDAEQNAEVRRVMMEKYGLARYLDDSGAVLLDTDETSLADPIHLYRKEIQGDEPLVMLRMLNSTPEPDGSARTYTLRVPPDMTTALDAMAWTFGMTASQYRPSVES